MSKPFRDFLMGTSLEPIAAETAPGRSYMTVSAATARARIEWDRAVVLSVAKAIEPDAASVMQWFSRDGIREFGGRTAQELVEEGATARLLEMLIAIRDGLRDC